jgi:phosphonate transport system substrate-binding protein
MNRCFLSIASLVLLFLVWPSYAANFNLSVQPVLPKQEMLKAYQPLAEYLSKQTGNNIKIKAYQNFLTYWTQMRKQGGFDLVLDAAHFTDYRVKKQGFEVLARLPNTVSFAVVTNEDNLVFDVDELVLKKMATMVSPSIGGIRLTELFSNPLQQPRLVYANNTTHAAQLVMDGKVDAAIIPTALVSNFDALNTVVTTNPLPHMAFSAAPSVPAEIKQSINKALLEAMDTAEGQAMLSKINYPYFEAASAKDYDGYARLLQNTLGY